MKGTSKVIMGATLVMVLTLAMVLGLVLVLLAELYCSLLLRRRQLRNTTSSSTTAAVTAGTTNTTSSQPSQPQTQNQSSPPPLSSYYAHGVLHAPRSFLFPKLQAKEENVDLEKHHSHLRQFLESHQTQESTTSPHRIGVVISSPPPPSPSLTPQPVQQVGGSTSKGNGCNSEGVCGSDKEQFIYISNPIYDNDARPSRDDTPFETPDTSPSRLEAGGSSSDDNDSEEEIVKPSSSKPSSLLPTTPPLTPMKKLPKEACSVSLRDARSLGTSGSDSNSNNGGSSSSSGSPCTSPSW